jgi:hypothetical protein
MRHDMTPPAQALTDYMSELSESAYYAGWMSGLEFELWRAVVDGPRRYGVLDITAEHIAELRRLSKACGGWIYFDDETEETFASLDDWRRRYAEHSE